MHKHHKIIIAVVTITVVVAATLYFALSKRHTDDAPTTRTTTEQPDQPQAGAPLSAAGQRARTLEREATESVETNPTKAHEKFVEAEKAYKQAGDELKASEMKNNASTVEQALPAEQPAQPLEETPLSTSTLP